MIAIQDFNSRQTIWTLMNKESHMKRSIVFFHCYVFKIGIKNRFLEKFFEHPETQNSILETQNLMLETQAWNFESRLVNLQLLIIKLYQTLQNAPNAQQGMTLALARSPGECQKCQASANHQSLARMASTIFVAKKLFKLRNKNCVLLSILPMKPLNKN